MTVYHSLKTLLIPDFIEALKGDLSVIVREGKVPDEQALKDKWQELSNEYLDLLDDTGAQHYLRDTGRIEDMSGKIERLKRAYNGLLTLYVDYNAHSPALAALIREDGISFSYEDEKSFIESLRRIPQHVKRLEKMLEGMIAKYEQGKAANDLKPEQIIGQNLAAIIEALKVDINENTLSVYRYCMLLNQVRTKHKLTITKGK